MLHSFATILLAGLKPLTLVLFSKAGLATAFLLGQQIGFCSGLLRFCRSAHTVPFLFMELRLRLNLRYWVVWLSRLVLQDKQRQSPPPTTHCEVLCFGIGRNILDLFKTLTLSDISPPALA
ncbi:MAG: hypothetical protein ONB48_14900 [candidate division KSB1 bacterium]|nr:hypothetical protein [candidate division KSB1 bacterium]MDZ7273473.1 hypothetical protein [candidate division KSB1 bacterium]MDZ7286935.1 hypothetical protein [candidate division KSB1 bacterium]MDZ7299712.1 hypothetical protein [candidate division KSB1 bacterium]MDZ7305651.1 hypothetical protein [candidate division KSB1 bacterium]